MAMQGADGLAALLAGLGFPQLQQARELQRLQQGAQRQQPGAQPNQAAQGGLRVEFGFGGQQQQFVFPPQFVPQQQQGQNGANAQPTTGPVPIFTAAMNVSLSSKSFYNILMF